MKTVKNDNSRRYRREWENENEFKAWLSEAPEKFKQPGHAYCKWCNKTLRPHKSTLSKHGGTEDHIQRGSAIISKAQRTLASCGVVRGTNENKINDIKLVLYAAVHGTINSIDHLGELLIKCGKGSLLEKTKLHRTKLEKLTKFAAPSFEKTIVLIYF
ncbi:hypothetical protein HCN44_011038 [Aphidius gifuensis]|uniref:Uncharacterized protein n=1 Tax=Aphidius gifuensis TaxID=684658 RepID=A0A835CZG4_APHGI|nr:hypothetical protein HCN44_011038 [Aphidius gifuensis]